MRYMSFTLCECSPPPSLAQQRTAAMVATQNSLAVCSGAVRPAGAGLLCVLAGAPDAQELVQLGAGLAGGRCLHLRLHHHDPAAVHQLQAQERRGPPPPRDRARPHTHTHTPYKSATGPAARLAHSLATAAERHAEQAVRPHSDSKATQTAKQHTETTHKNSPTQTESYLLATAQYCYVILTLNPGRVQHMPWRVMCYKSLNTFVDDLFAFIIKMPMLHRIACFRDGATCTFAASCGQASTLPIEPCWRRLLIARARWLCAQTSYFSSSCTSGTFTRSI